MKPTIINIFDDLDAHIHNGTRSVIKERFVLARRLLYKQRVEIDELQASHDKLLIACKFAFKCTQGGYSAKERNDASIKVRRMLEQAIEKGESK